MYRFPDEPNFASFASALRAGSPEAIVAFNPGVLVPAVAHSKFEDDAAGEVDRDDLPQPAAAAGCSVKGPEVQFHILTYLGKTWCGGERPQWPDDTIIGYTRHVVEKGVAITFDVPIETAAA